MKSTTKSNQYTPEFRASAVKLAIESDQPISQTADELGVNPNTLHNWISKHRQLHGLNNQPTIGTSPDDQIKLLRKENKRLREERDILKKATAYFARNQM